MNKLLKDLKEQINKTKKDLNKVKKENTKLKDELDSVWGMLDEIAEADIENYAHLLEKIENDAMLKRLMTTTKKADC